MSWALRTSATRAANVGNPGASWNGGNLGAATVNGDRIIAAFDCSRVATQPHVVSVASTGGGSIKWSRDLIIQAFHNGAFEELTIWSGVCLADGSVTAITATFSDALSAASGCSCAIAAFSGLAQGNGLGVDQNGIQDLVSGAFADTVGNTTCDSKATLIGTNKPNQLVIGATGDSGATVTLSAGSGFTLAVKTDLNGNGECLLEYKDSGAAGFPQQATATASGSIFDMTGVVVYRLFAGNTIRPSRRPAPFRPAKERVK